MTLTIFFILSVYMPIIVPWAVFLAAAAVYIRRKSISLPRWSKRLMLVMAVYYPLYALINTIGQYEVWVSNSNPLAKYLAHEPIPSTLKGLTWWYDLPFMHTGIGYIIFYSWGRFWLGALLAIVAAFVFWLILRVLQKYQDRFFENGEVELGVLTALLVGWPGFVVFIPLLFISVVIVALFRMIFLKEAYTTLGAPMLFAVLLFLIFGSQLLAITGLQVLKA